MTAPQNPRVTQADREAAKSLLGRDDAGPSWWSIDSGNADNDPMVQAFARHREAAEAASKAREAALVEALGRLVETVEGRADILGGYDGRFNVRKALRQARATLAAKGEG